MKLIKLVAVAGFLALGLARNGSAEEAASQRGLSRPSATVNVKRRLSLEAYTLRHEKDVVFSRLFNKSRPADTGLRSLAKMVQLFISDLQVAEVGSFRIKIKLEMR